MSEIILKADERSEFGKGAARRLRREGHIPAVLYGHGIDPLHVALDGHATFLALRGNVNAVVTLEMPSRSELALAREVQRDPVRREITHVDFVLVRRGEKVEVEIPVTIEGEPFDGAIAAVELLQVPVLAEATKIPESFVLSVEGLEAGVVLRAEDIEMPEGVELNIEDDSPVVLISAPAAEEEEDELLTIEVADDEDEQEESTDE